MSSAPPCAGETAESRWFRDEVHAHDSQLKAYLRGSFPAVRDVDDVVQESYLRIWKARTCQPIQRARAFLFRIARNLCLDHVKSAARHPVESIGDFEAIGVSHPEGAVDTITAEEKLDILTDALAALPPRCREVFMLCKFQGHSHAEAALKLGLSPRTVDAQIQKAFERLGRDLRRRGVHHFSR